MKRLFNKFYTEGVVMYDLMQQYEEVKRGIAPYIENLKGIENYFEDLGRKYDAGVTGSLKDLLDAELMRFMFDIIYSDEKISEAEVILIRMLFEHNDKVKNTSPEELEYVIKNATKGASVPKILEAAVKLDKMYASRGVEKSKR